MSPRRLVTPAWWHRHGAVVGYFILVVGIAFTIRYAVQSSHDNSQRIVHSSCLAAKETRGPLIQYLETQLALSDKAKSAHLLPSSPPALRKLQDQSLENLRTLTRVYKERQALPCPPAP